MSKWVVFYDDKNKELAAYTKAKTFAGEREMTAELLAHEHGISAKEIIVKEEERVDRAEVLRSGAKGLTAKAPVRDDGAR
jgi:hypothetical protein